MISFVFSDIFLRILQTYSFLTILEFAMSHAYITFKINAKESISKLEETLHMQSSAFYSLEESASFTNTCQLYGSFDHTYHLDYL